MLHDASFNVMGIVEAYSGRLVERYEYTPYGERKVYAHGWLYEDVTGDAVVNPSDLAAITQDWLGSGWSQGDINGDGFVNPTDLGLNTAAWLTSIDYSDADPWVSYPLLRSVRGTGAPHGLSLCDFGHQGLMHDEATGLIYNRARMRHAELGRFMQRDPLGYVDGRNLYMSHNIIDGGYDPSGLMTESEWEKYSREQKMAWLMDLYNKTGKEIERAATKYCVPKQLLFAIAASEQISYPSHRQVGDKAGIGRTPGLFQLSVDVLQDSDIDIYHARATLYLYGYNDGGWILTHYYDPSEIYMILDGVHGKKKKNRAVFSYLQTLEGNVDASASLIKRRLNELCNASKKGQIHKSFILQWSLSCDISQFCCTQQSQGNDCNKIVNMEVPECLARSVQAIWDGGGNLPYIDTMAHDSDGGRIPVYHDDHPLSKTGFIVELLSSNYGLYRQVYGSTP